MALDLVKKKYVCKSCQHKGAIFNAIKKNEVLRTDFLKEHTEHLGEILPMNIYRYNVIRDECDVVLYNKPYQCLCEKCGSINIEYTPDQKFDNVLNFYPICENEKWLRGFNDLGMSR